MYILAPNQTAEKYPYSIGALRRDNPNTSFPRNPSDAILSRFNVFPVYARAQPRADHTKNVTEGTPVLQDGKWTQTWDVIDATAEEIAERNDNAADAARARRNALIAETDYLALTDNTLTTEMSAYRQALRDITSHANWPHLTEADWPVKP